MSAGPLGLEFEQPIRELEEKIKSAQSTGDESPDHIERVREMKREWTALIREVYRNLTPWQRVRVARHPDRPHTKDYLKLAFDEFVELHGDRLFGDDRALLTGFAKLGNAKVMVVGHQKGRTVKEREPGSADGTISSTVAAKSRSTASTWTTRLAPTARLAPRNRRRAIG